MDAMPITIAQQFGGYARQLRLGVDRIQDAKVRLSELPQGGTAVGHWNKYPPELWGRICKQRFQATQEYPLERLKITLKLKQRSMLL